MSEDNAIKPDDTQAADTARKMPRSFAALESIPFRWLISSLGTFFLAMQGQLVVRSLLAWELTESTFSLALVNLVIATPMSIGLLFSGAVIDRVERRKLTIISQAIVLVNELIVLVLLVAGKLEFWHLLATAFVLGVNFPFLMPTRTAMIYPLVGREKLGNAMALQATSLNIARIVGPAGMGLLIPLITMPGAYLVSILLYGFSIFGMVKLPKSYPDNKNNKGFFTDVKYSFTYVASNKPILLCLVFGLFPMLLAIPIISFLVVFTESIWQVSETKLGIMMGSVGVGGIIGSLLVARLGDTMKRTRVMMFAALTFGIFLAGFSISPYYYVALPILLVANIFANMSQTLNQTLVQLLADNEVRGRMSSLMMLTIGLTPLGVLPVAYFAEFYGIANTMFVACIMLVLVVLAFFMLSPTLRELDKDSRLTDVHELGH
ncbi:MFS transporter [Gammaproteobacteria bacterium]|nr:MFS transporter [Gammaproteobacteria bacterium]